MRVGQAASRYGTPEPQIEVRTPKGTHFRKLHAALHMLAAEAELATPAGESWVVQTDATSDQRGRIYLELADGNEQEAARGLELLRRLRA
ncbi:MAG: hypothetical protein HOO96_29720 [Polyangiaceae bacterium]|nr:hypothetical protein [Polyangiaceae bacterium]